MFPRHAVFFFFELLRWTSKLSPAATNENGSTLFNQGGVISTQQVQADFLPFASTPDLERDTLQLANTVWVQDDAQSHCSELATGQPLLSTYRKKKRKNVDVLLQGQELLPVEYSILVFRQ